MAQIAIIQASGPQPAPANPSVNNEQSQFSPHLENALSGKTKPPPQKANTSQQSPSTTDNDAPNPTAPESSETVNESFSPPTQESTVITEMFLTATITAEITKVTQTTHRPVSGSALSTSIPIPEQQILNLLAQKSSPGSAQLHYSMNETVNYSEAQLATSSSLAQLTISGLSTQAGTTFENQPLLTQLERIINNSNETGSVSISKAESSPSIIASTTEAPAANAHGLFTTSGDGFKTVNGRPDQQLSSLRQDSQQQYYDAKVNLQNNGENSTSSQNTSQGGDTPAQSFAPAQQNGLAAEPEPGVSFSQGSVLVPEAPVQTTGEAAKTILLPSGTVVYEEEIVQQLIQRFQISGKLTDTRINIKLNPAELGEVKIDLAVKDGSIKAHVVAQSQQALEIIEKNISKLRAVLEDQGYTIDEIAITSESDSVGDFNHFDNQLFGQNDYTPPAAKNTKEPGEIFNPEHLLQDNADDISGVNVRI